MRINLTGNQLHEVVQLLLDSLVLVGDSFTAAVNFPKRLLQLEVHLVNLIFERLFASFEHQNFVKPFYDLDALRELPRVLLQAVPDVLVGASEPSLQILEIGLAGQGLRKGFQSLEVALRSLGLQLGQDAV